MPEPSEQFICMITEILRWPLHKNEQYLGIDFSHQGQGLELMMKLREISHFSETVLVWDANGGEKMEIKLKKNVEVIFSCWNSKVRKEKDNKYSMRKFIWENFRMNEKSWADLSSATGFQWVSMLDQRVRGTMRNPPAERMIKEQATNPLTIHIILIFLNKIAQKPEKISPNYHFSILLNETFPRVSKILKILKGYPIKLWKCNCLFCLKI